MSRAFDHPENVVRRIRKWLAVARKIARQAQRRRVTPDFGIVAAGLEEALLPAFVYSYRRGLAMGKRQQTATRKKTIWQQPGDTFVTDTPVARKDDDRRAMWLWFAAGAGSVAIAVRNTVARVVDWLDRQFRKTVGLPVGKPLGIGSGGVLPPGIVLPMPVTGHNFVPQPLPPKKPMVEGEVENEPEFPIAPALAIINDQLYDLSQRAIIEYARQVGALELTWHTKEDEKVCPICAPLDGKTVKPGEPFSFRPDGTPIYNAPVHGQCRCKLSITKWKKVLS